ncbi:MAG: hypothetical protein ACREC5_07110, partial [Thermoplasmata archaeon]
MSFEGNVAVLNLEEALDPDVPGDRLFSQVKRRELLERLRKAERTEAELREAREENRRLKEEIQRLKTSAPLLAASDRTAEAGGAPSSKTFYRRPISRGEPRSSGGPRGHRGHGRSRPTPNSSPVRVGLERCPECSTELGEPCDSLHRGVTDLPLPHLMTFDLELLRYRCPGCHRRVHAQPPLPPNQQFGPVLAAWIAHQRMLGLSVEKVRTSAKESFGLEISEASIRALEAWVAGRLDTTYAT